MSNSVVQTSCQSIDHLPDDVLQHLLSFLPTKEAVATSILSKRWSYLWQWVPVLDLQDSPSCKSDEKQRKAFRQLVYKALIHSNVDSLYKFRLNCDIIHGPSSLNTWINSAVHRFIFQGEVDISISATGKSPFLKLPNNFFTSKSLKVVKLSNQILIDVPNSMSVCFPSLKVLHLQLVEFANGESFSRLLQGCTSLEELFVSRFFNDNVKNLIIYVHTLKMLNIIQQLGEANWLELASQGYELKINAPNLEYLNILDLGSLVHFESIFISLIEANISFNGIGLIRLSEALCNAKFLYLQWIHSPDYIEFLNHAALPFFPNLILLQLGIGFDDWKIISHFLVRSTHQLEVLTINKIRVIGSEEPWWVSKGLSPYVTNVYGGGSPGDELGMEVVEYTLEGHSVWRLLRKFLKHRKKHSPKLIQPEI